MRYLFLSLIWLYRWTISPVIGNHCRFHPTCSCYALESIESHGALRGLLLAAWRILRCNPFVPGGADPVPPVKSQ